MNYSKRTGILVAIDLCLVWLSVYSAFYLFYHSTIPAEKVDLWLMYGVISSVVSIVCMFHFKLYNRIWQYASIGELISIAKTVMVSTVGVYLLANLITMGDIPVSILLHTAETTLLLLGGSRFVWRVFCEKFGTKKLVQGTNKSKKALIIGAGSCGTLFAKELKNNENYVTVPFAFVDDDPYKQNLQVYDLPVLGGSKDIPAIVEKHGIDEVIIAMPSVSKAQTTKIINICKTTKARVKIIPYLQEIILGKTTLNQVRDVQVEDLLGRDPICTDLQGIANYVDHKVVLVTGAGGSIGSELCRQIAPFHPKKLLLLGHGENSIYTIEMEMRRLIPDLELETIIADVQDRARLEELFHIHAPQVIFHAAAHKHVPLMERNPSEAIKNNVFGTKNVAECADQFHAERFVLISSDKAVNPTSVMGTTKRIAEMFIQSLDKQSETKFVAVRFGNVLGSRGSVIPRFKEQIQQGGPVTVTHPEMVRYFMTIPEAVQLVIQTGALAQGGEIFILDMGAPVKIYDLAADLIRLSGFEPHEDIAIHFTGMREGEKLYEELLTNEEGISSTMHDRIFIGKPMNINRTELEFEIRKLEKVLGNGQKEIRDMLKHMVPSYSNVS